MLEFLKLVDIFLLLLNDELLDIDLLLNFLDDILLLVELFIERNQLINLVSKLLRIDGILSDAANLQRWTEFVIRDTEVVRGLNGGFKYLLVHVLLISVLDLIQIFPITDT